MATIVCFVSRCGLSIDTCHRNQPNKSKLVLHKPFLSLQQSFETAVYIQVTRQRASVILMDVAYVGIVHVSRCSKEELAWAIDKQAHSRQKGGG